MYFSFKGHFACSNVIYRMRYRNTHKNRMTAILIRKTLTISNWTSKNKFLWRRFEEVKIGFIPLHFRIVLKNSYTWNVIICYIKFERGEHAIHYSFHKVTHTLSKHFLSPPPSCDKVRCWKCNWQSNNKLSAPYIAARLLWWKPNTDHKSKFNVTLDNVTSGRTGRFAKTKKFEKLRRTLSRRAKSQHRRKGSR